MDHLNYLFQFLVGGCLFVLIYHFTKNRNTVVSSIIPAFPTLFLTGFFYLVYFGGDHIQYVQNCLFTFGLDIVLFLLILGLYTLFPNYFQLYFGIAFLIYLTLLVMCVYFDIIN